MWRSKWTVLIIVLLAVVVRLIGIGQPFFDPWSWRQSDVAAIARNFLENGFHFSYPQIDWAGDAPGYVGTEFPILAAVAVLFALLFGISSYRSAAPFYRPAVAGLRELGLELKEATTPNLEKLRNRGATHLVFYVNQLVVEGLPGVCGTACLERHAGGDT